MFELDQQLLKNTFGKQIMGAFEDPLVSEIIINSDGSFILEDSTKGKHKVGRIENKNDILHAISLIAQYRGVYLNDDSPDMCVALPFEKPFCGARMQALVPPVTSAPSLTIRKHLKREIDLKSYVENDILCEAGFSFLQECVKTHRNIIVSGRPKSGKTTLTLALLSEIPKLTPNDRVLVLEDTPELIVPIEDVQYLQTSTNRNMTNLVKCAMSMRPDRIVVGEVTDRAAHAMLKAWNTGCPGGVSTLHANNTQALPQRLIDLSCENEIPPPISLITTTVDVLVHIERADHFKAGRKVTEISALKGFDRQRDQFLIENIINTTQGEIK